MKKNLRLGSRGSPLALVQADIVRRRLLAAHPRLQAECDIEIVPIRTSGDWRPQDRERVFADMGGDKGLFTKELEEALCANVIDLAVHSMKDMPTRLPDGLALAAVPERADPRDAFISSKQPTLDALPPGSVIGISSLRRQAQILARRPDLRVVPLRGNVDTRLAKLAEGKADATLLAVAGLQRLGSENRISSILETDIMLPAAAQGALGIEIRRDDDDMRRLLAAINHPPSAMCVTAERALLLALDGSCHTPIAVLAKLEGERIMLDALVARPDGSEVIRMHQSAAAAEAETLGRHLGEAIKGRLPPDFFIQAA